MDEMGHAAETFPFTFEAPANDPTSPPTTPGSRAQPRFPPFAGQTSPSSSRNAFSKLADSPPMDFPDHKGQAPHAAYRFPRQVPRDQSRQSTASPVTDSATSRDSSPEVDSVSDREEPKAPVRRVVVEESDLIVEEVSASDSDKHRYLPVVHPDQIEDIMSDQEAGNSLADNVARRFRDLTCAADLDTDEELEKWRAGRKARKRFSGLFKRSHSKSEENSEGEREVSHIRADENSNRRLRRRLTKPSEKLTPVIQSMTSSSVGAAEPSEEAVLDDDTDGSLGQLPFYLIDDPMDLDTDTNDQRLPAKR